MKAVIVSQPGGVDVLEVKEVAKPKLKVGWSLVKVQGFDQVILDEDNVL